MNTQSGYIICVHRAPSSIFGAASRPLNRNGAVLFFENEGRARFERDMLNARSTPLVHYTVEPVLSLTAPFTGDKSSAVAQEAAA